MKGRNRVFAALVAAALAIAAGAAMAETDDRSVNEKILDILLEQGTLSQERYDALMEEARAEKRAAALPAVAAAAEEGPEDWKAYWKEGLRVERNDGLFKVKVGGRIHYDVAASAVDGKLENALQAFDLARDPDADPRDPEGYGSDFRRARLFVSGSFGEHGIFKVNYDFAGQDADFNDVYVGLRKIPVLGTVRAGHFKEPMSLEMTDSSKYITFLERGLPVLAFTAERNTGIGFHNQLFDERMTVHVGAFQEVGDSGERFDDQGGYSAGARVTTLPVWNPDQRQLVHTGLWFSRRFDNNETLQYDADAESNTVGSLLEFPELEVDGINVFGGELAFVRGPFSMQGEFIGSFVNADAGLGDYFFYGSYVTGSVFLTGESRAYDQEYGSFGRTRPNEPFSISKGQWGAVELAARWSHLSLNDDDVRGGILNDFTFGVNWYLYPNLRLMANYVLANRNGIGQAHVAQSRLSLDF